MSYSLRPSWLALALMAGLVMPAQDGLAKPVHARASTQASLEKSGLRLHLVAPDVAKLRHEDGLRDSDKSAPLRYGRVLSVGKQDVNQGAGVWTMQADGQWHWQLEVMGKGAKSLEFQFSRFRLPHGAQLTIRSADGKDALAALDDSNNPRDGKLNTPMLLGEHAILELVLPADKRSNLELTLATVAWGYRDPFDAVRAKSGRCNVDAICPEGDAWREQIAAVAGYAFSAAGDQLMCTGTLMNTGNDDKDINQPRFSTAYHCVSDASTAASMVFYWGYESPTCRTVGSGPNGSALPVRPNTRAVQMGGATLVSTNKATDFTVVELNSPMPGLAQAYFSGWDRSGAIPSATVGIHHPSGHEKRLVFEDDPPTVMYNCYVGGPDSTTHWRVGPYELGTTEGGSSGSGLWNGDNGLLIGVLTGGDAGCGYAEGYDCYGRLSRAWDIASDTGISVREALDRSGANPQVMPGKSTCDAPQVSLTSSAFATAPKAGQSFEIKASARGGAGGYTYLWDIDGDGVIEREGGSTVKLSFPEQSSFNVWVRVRDSDGCVGSVTQALDIAAPVLEVTQVGTAQQVCGNDNGSFDPGERFTLPVTFKNRGGAALPAGAHALFAPVGSLVGNGIDNEAGYEGATSCGYQFIDIAQGALAVPALETYVGNGNNYGPRDDARSTEITLGGPGFQLYGQTWTKAVMSTNGYVSFDPQETGGDYYVDCSGELDEGARGPQLRPYHDDMVVREGAGDGLRYRWFATCPRLASSGVAQGCHVFQWTGMGYWMGAGEDLEGDFEFQAVAYAQTGEVAYQYSTAAPDEGDLANIGLIGVGGNDPLNLWCQSYAQPARENSALCIHSPQALAEAKPVLRLESPTVSLPAIQAGGSATVNVPLAISTDAGCGVPLRIDYIATAAAASFSTLASSHAIGAVADSCVQVSSCPLPDMDRGTRDGNYSNLARQGNGFNYHDFGGVWYTGASDHTSAWYIAAGEFRDNLLVAPLLYMTFPDGLSDLEIPEVPPYPGELLIQQNLVGQIHIANLTNEQIMMAWRFNDGRSGAEVLDLTTQGLARADPDHTQHWFPYTESGWGLDVESLRLGQNRMDVVLPYFYDSQGKPRWVLSEGAIGANGVVPLSNYRPHCPGCLHYDDWDAASRVAPAGSLKLQWQQVDKAIISTDISLPAPLQGDWIRGNKVLLPMGAIRP